jgi:hypothetical protein
MQVTIFTPGEFLGSINGIVAKLRDIETRSYAQYKRAVFVEFIPKRKRKARRLIRYSHEAPYLLILEGEHALDLDALQKVTLEEDERVKVTQSKYPCFDTRYESDFDAVINAYIDKTGAAVVFDSRTAEKYAKEAEKHSNIKEA